MRARGVHTRKRLPARGLHQNTRAHTRRAPSARERGEFTRGGDCRHVSVLKTTDFMRRILLYKEEEDVKIIKLV